MAKNSDDSGKRGVAADRMRQGGVIVDRRAAKQQQAGDGAERNGDDLAE